MPMTIDKKIKLLTQYCMVGIDMDGENIRVRLYFDPLNGSVSFDKPPGVVGIKDATYYGQTVAEAIDNAIEGSLDAISAYSMRLAKNANEEKAAFDAGHDKQMKRIANVFSATQELKKAQTK